MNHWGGGRYCSYCFLTSALDEVVSRPCFSPGEGLPLPIGQEAGWAPEPIWTHRLEEKSSCFCQGSSPDRSVVQSVVRHCTDWAILAPTLTKTVYLYSVNFKIVNLTARKYFFRDHPSCLYAFHFFLVVTT
jgi:hypothetical protein